MLSTHVIVGLLIGVAGLLLLLDAAPLPRQAARYYMPLRQVEPALVSWLVRILAVIIIGLGAVTALTAFS